MFADSQSNHQEQNHENVGFVIVGLWWGMFRGTRAKKDYIIRGILDYRLGQKENIGRMIGKPEWAQKCWATQNVEEVAKKTGIGKGEYQIETFIH